jgi:8-oxo-dGTP pyrophosphatase MutT (NUDIX family)
LPNPALSSNLLHLADKFASINHSNDEAQVEAVVAILLWDEPGRGLQTLLVQRAEREGDPWSGQIGLPGGRVKPVESARAALHREVEEEVGIKLEEVGTELGKLSVGHPMRRTGMRVQPWVYGLRIKPVVNIGPTEIADSFWVNLAELPSKKEISEITIRNEPWRVESFVVEGKIVWGFTYRVLTELIPILEISL